MISAAPATGSTRRVLPTTSGVLTKTAANGWGTGGANSYSVLAANTDGWVEFAVNGGSQRFRDRFRQHPDALQLAPRSPTASALDATTA